HRLTLRLSVAPSHTAHFPTPHHITPHHGSDQATAREGGGGGRAAPHEATERRKGGEGREGGGGGGQPPSGVQATVRRNYWRGVCGTGAPMRGGRRAGGAATRLPQSAEHCR